MWNNIDYLHMLVDGNAAGIDLALQALGHQLGGQRSCAGGATAGVVVGLVADVLAVAVGGEGNAQLSEVEEAAGGECCLDQCVIAVYTATAEQILRHGGGRVGRASRQAHFVVGLFIRAGVAGGAVVSRKTKNSNILLSELVQAKCRVAAGCANADDGGGQGDCVHRYSLCAFGDQEPF